MNYKYQKKLQFVAITLCRGFLIEVEENECNNWQVCMTVKQKKLQLLKVTLEAGSCGKKRKFTAQWYKGSFGLQLLSAFTTSVWSVLTFNCKGLNLEMCVLFWCLLVDFHGII